MAATLLAAMVTSGILTLVAGLYARLAIGLIVGGSVYVGASYFVNREWLLSMKELVSLRKPT